MGKKGGITIPMITEEYFLSKVSELAHMKCVPISRQSAKEVHERFVEFEKEDLDYAIDELIFTEQRFDFTKLLRSMTNKRADRIEARSEEYKRSEAEAAQRFFSPRYEGECRTRQCPKCRYLRDCKIRATEWMKGINTILDLSKTRAPGEGQRMAEELINYMTNEFKGS